MENKANNDVLGAEAYKDTPDKEKWLKTAWNWLKGKKRNIGITLLSLIDAFALVFPKQIPPEVYIKLVSITNGLLLGGMADTEAGRKIIKGTVKGVTNGAKRITKKLSGKGS